MCDVVHTSADSLVLVGNFDEGVVPELGLWGGAASEDKLFIGILYEDSEIVNDVIFNFHCDLAGEQVKVEDACVGTHWR